MLRLRLRSSSLVLATLLALLPAGHAATAPTGSASATTVRPSADYGKLPLQFEPNQGQNDPRVRFAARSQGISVFLEDTAASLVLGARNGEGERPAVVRMELLGAGSPKSIAGADRRPGIANYFRGQDPKRWRTNIPFFAKVRYEQVYDGVDLVYYGNQGRLEYDFEIAPGADPASVLLGFQGADRLRLDSSGELVIDTKAGELRLKKPYAYQEAAGGRREVQASFALLAGGRVGFSLGAYDRKRPLVIDPVLIYSTLLGGSNDYGMNIAVDASGAAYITGYTNSVDFPAVVGAPYTHPGTWDVFVVKLNAAGTDVLYSTCFGGANGEQGYGIGIDDSGNAYVVGITNSTDFPLLNPVQGTLGGGNDGFALKLNPQGNALLYSTYLGGTATDVANSIAVIRQSGVAYIAGTTGSSGFYASPGAFQTSKSTGDDGFVVKLASDGARLFSTFLGATGTESAEGIAVDGNGDPYVTGHTTSTTFPTTAGVIQTSLSGPRDVFVTKLKADGTGPLQYSTYFGGSGADWAWGIAVDSAGNAYVTGDTYSLDLPTTTGVVQESITPLIDRLPYVFKLNPTATGRVYCTYLGSASMQSRAWGIAVDGSNNAYITGYTYTNDYPNVSAIQPQSSVPWTESGVFIVGENGGADWDDFGVVNDYFIQAVSVDPSNPAILVVGGSRGINRSTDSGANWTHTPVFTTTTALGRAASAPSTMYAAVGNVVYTSTDGGANWTSNPAIPGVSGNSIVALVVHPTTPASLFAATSVSGLYLSIDSGASWSTRIGGGLPNVGINDVVYDPTDPAVVYAATAVGTYKSGDGGATWTYSNENGPEPATGFPNGVPRPLLIDPSDTDVLYVRTANLLFKSTDAGAHWSILKTFDTAIKNIALAPSNPLVLYAITLTGIYRSADAGATWDTKLEGILLYPGVPALVVHPSDPDVLYAGLSNSSDAFVTKLNSTATAYLYSTFLGGSAADVGYSIAVDATGNAYVTGSSNSLEFPTTSGSYAPLSPGTGAFVTKISDATPSCTYVVKPGKVSSSGLRFFSNAGGRTDFVVIAPSGCDWQAVSNAPWITIGGQLENLGRGPGTGSFVIFVAANTGASRQGTVSVAGETLTIQQAGSNCTYSLGNTAQPVASGGGSLSVSVTGTAGCLWGVDNATPWITPGAGSGTGSGSLSLTIGANPSALPRYTTLFVGGQSFLVSQGGTGVSYAFDPPSVSVGSDGPSGSVTVTPSPSTAGFRAFTDQPWLSVQYISGNTINYSIGDNDGEGTDAGKPRTGHIIVGNDVFTVNQAARPPIIGTYKAGVWRMDTDFDGLENLNDVLLFGWAGATPVVGDWDGEDGWAHPGLYADGIWFLDIEDVGVWDPGVTDKVVGWGWPGATPVVGDWNGDGKTEIGVYSGGVWFLDYNGDFLWDGGIVDKAVGWGWTGVTPVVGDWNGDGRTKIGVYINGVWFLDYDGSYTWDGGTADKVVGWGWTGTTPVLGDWNGDGKTKVGTYIDGYWFLDYDGNYAWDGGTVDKQIQLGWAGVTPEVGDWNGDGKSKAGIFVSGYWYLDYDGNGVWEGVGSDRIYQVGDADGTPLVAP